MPENTGEGVVIHPRLGQLRLGGEVAKVRLEPGDRKSATTVLRKFGPAVATEAMMFISEHLNSEDEKARSDAIGLVKSFMPYMAQKTPTTTINVEADGGEIKTDVKQALKELLGEKIGEADYEVED